MAAWYTRHVDEYYIDRQDQLDRLMYDNALALLPRLAEAPQA
jgi:hypothetical protein